MGSLRKLMFIVSLLLIALPLLSWFGIFSIIPTESLFGFDYELWCFGIGIILLISVFFSWKAARVRMRAYQAMQTMPERQRIASGSVGQWPTYRP